MIIGSYDRRLVWFDLDLGSAPYKTLKYHTKALREVQYHKQHPLMATVRLRLPNPNPTPSPLPTPSPRHQASDDGTVHVFHSTVYSDLLRDPLIVPVKVI